ncbi:hypothetical protein [Streptomyces sp. NPDC015130]|uniref:hypothetical protein n=1 Tax=Streptomyces sp. NPDC015130 TaxID=3364940 RepID=UPI0037013953
MLSFVTSDHGFGHGPEEPAPHVSAPVLPARSAHARPGRPHDGGSGARSFEAL